MSGEYDLKIQLQRFDLDEVNYNNLSFEEVLKKYSPRFFIQKFKSIPREEWRADGQYSEGADDPQKCALGHCGMEFRKKLVCRYDSSKLMRKVNQKLLKQTHKPLEGFVLAYYFLKYINVPVWFVNDQWTHVYHQTNPRDRILAALTDIEMVRNGIIEECPSLRRSYHAIIKGKRRMPKNQKIVDSERAI